jgi:hypothetical protein
MAKMNGFLAALDNIATAPVNVMSTTGNVLWPTPFLVQTYTAAEEAEQTRLFGNCPTRFVRFAKAIQLLWLVEDSVLAAAIAEVDSVITYRDQLIGQLTDVDPLYLHAVSDALGQLPFMQESILDQDLRAVWEKSITPADRLATFVVHFGRKHA